MATYSKTPTVAIVPAKAGYNRVWDGYKWTYVPNAATLAAQKANAAYANDYGYVATFLKAHPDVAALVKQAQADSWTQARLEQAVRGTTWWTSRTDAQRQYELLAAQNPKQAEALVTSKTTAVTQMATALGLSLDSATAKSLALMFVQNGSSDSEIQAILAGKFQLTEDASGQAAVTVDQLRSIAQDYGITLDAATLQNYTQQVLAGTMTPEGLTDHIREQAKILYPTIASTLDRGVSVKQFLSPYLQIAANELGIPVEQMDTTNTWWTKPITGGATGAPMTSDEWTKTIRNEAWYGWDKTYNARSTAAQLLTQLADKMGAAA